MRQLLLAIPLIVGLAFSARADLPADPTPKAAKPNTEMTCNLAYLGNDSTGIGAGKEKMYLGTYGAKFHINPDHSITNIHNHKTSAPVIGTVVNPDKKDSPKAFLWQFDPVKYQNLFVKINFLLVETGTAVQYVYFFDEDAQPIGKEVFGGKCTGN